MKRTSLFLPVLLLAAGGALQAQDVAGDWLGTLKAGPLEIRLGLHIAKAPAGGLQATIDVIDQGINGLAVDPVKVSGSDLNFKVSMINASYAGKLSADGSSIAGTFTQGQDVPLEFRRGAFKAEHKAAKPSDIDGTWNGSIDTPQGSLHIVFHFVNTEDGLIATADSPDQGAKGIPVTSVSRKGSALTMDMKGLAGGYEGTISADLSTIDGTWTQVGNSIPLVLKKAK